MIHHQQSHTPLDV